MERKGCISMKLDGSNYSSPMPLIGFYIATATLVCLLFIIFDIFTAFRNTKRWIPCRLFSINSVTLTLISIASKLPLDLTTSMPSVQDQLSKLTGTTFICICMGFFMPSLGTSSHSECFTNMAALSIFVITVVVNICIQMHTGVIILFRVQHIIILCCMMVLLMALWHCALDIHSQNEASIDGIKENFRHGEKSMLYRLKLCYLYSYNTNPQFVLCRNLINTVVSTLCSVCSAVVLKVAFESLVSKKFELCTSEEIVSDYKGSMRIIVVSQMIAIFVGSLAITFRILTLIGHLQSNPRVLQEQFKDAQTIVLQNAVILKPSLLDCFIALMKVLIWTLVICIEILAAFPFWMLEGCVKPSDLHPEGGCHFGKTKYEDDEDVKEFKDLIHNGEMGLDEWTLYKGVKDMKKWMQVVIKTKISNEQLMILLSTVPSPRESSSLSLLKARYDLIRPGYKMSSISIVLLVRIATISIPSSLSRSLSSSLDEVFEIIHFVDKKMSSSSFENKNKSIVAEILRGASTTSSSLIPKIVKKSEMEAFRKQPLLDQAIGIIKGLKGALPSDSIWNELGIITDFILSGAYRSIGDLHDYIEELFVDMVNEFLVQLPNAIFKEIIESHAEDCEERVKAALKILFKVEQLEGLVKWSFPAGTTITRLTTDEASDMRLESNASSICSFHSVRDFGHDSVSMTTQDEIILQVE